MMPLPSPRGIVFARDDGTTNSPHASDPSGSAQASPRDNVVFEAGLFGAVNARTSGFSLRANAEDMSILNGQDDRQRAELIAERLTRWKSATNA